MSQKLIEIIEKDLEQEEKEKLLHEFSDYLQRRKLAHLYYVENNLDESDKIVKQHLYEFVNSRWHNLLEPIQSLEEFTAHDRKKSA